MWETLYAVPIAGKLSRGKRPDRKEPLFRLAFQKLCLKLGLVVIFLFGVALRLAYFNNEDYRTSWVNDIGDHFAYVMYIKDRHKIPSPRERWEFPQEPLYYLLAAQVVHPDKNLQNQDERDPANLFYICLLGNILSNLSLLFLFFASFSLSSWLARYGTVLFASLAPFFLVHSTCVGNDCLLYFGSCLFYYFMIRLNREPTPLNFWLSVFALMLSLFSKMNGISLVIGVPWMLWRCSDNFKKWRLLLWRTIAVAFLGSFWLFTALYRAYQPDSHTFLFLVHFELPSQDIRVPFISYFTTFKPCELLESGQASLLEGETSDALRFSYHSFLYATFIVGAWNYHTCPEILWANRALFLFGLVLPFGMILFIFKVLRFNSFFNMTAFGIVFTAWVLNVHLMITETHTCHADARLYFASVPWLLYCCSRGWTVCGRGKAMRLVIWFLLFCFTISCGAYDIVLFSTDKLPNTGY
jgi:hypothetical protein